MYIWELDVQPISSDKYSGRCVTQVDQRFALSGELGGDGEACGGTVATGEGAVIEVGCLFRMNCLLLTKTLPLWVLTKYFLYGPIPVIVPYVSHSLVVGFCIATWFPISKSGSVWAADYRLWLSCLTFLGAFCQPRWQAVAILEQRIGDELGGYLALGGRTVSGWGTGRLFDRGCCDIATKL